MSCGRRRGRGQGGNGSGGEGKEGGVRNGGKVEEDGGVGEEVKGFGGMEHDGEK